MPIPSGNDEDVISLKGMFKKVPFLTLPTSARQDARCLRQGRKLSHCVPQGATIVDARSVQRVREHGKMARTTLADFFNIPIWEILSPLEIAKEGPSVAGRRASKCSFLLRFLFIKASHCSYLGLWLFQMV